MAEVVSANMAHGHGVTAFDESKRAAQRARYKTVHGPRLTPKPSTGPPSP